MDGRRAAGLGARVVDDARRPVVEHDDRGPGGLPTHRLCSDQSQAPPAQQCAQAEAALRPIVGGFGALGTEFDIPLPVDRAIAERALGLLRARALVETLSAAATTDEALEIISAGFAFDRIVEAHKWRRLYQRGSCLVDDVRFEVRGPAFRSIGVESTEQASHCEPW